MTASHSSSPHDTNMRSRTMPALLTTTSSRPKASSADATTLGAVPVGHVVAVDDGLAAAGHDVVDHLLCGRHRAARAVELGPDVVDHHLGALPGELERGRGRCRLRR